MKQTGDAYPFTTEAMVLLPEHLHCIWTLPENDTDYSMRWGLIKKEFTKRARYILDGKVGIAVGTRHGGACRSRVAHPTEDGLDDRHVGWAVPTERPPRPSASRIKHREGAVWQRRFWEHRIRDQEDFNAHVEYIHYNPVKHGLAKAPIEWAYSSFGRYVRDGIYDRDWGADGDITFDDAVGNE